jgi:hypothetical protein
VVIYWLVALKNAAYNLNVFTRASKWLGVGLDVPALNYLWARRTEAKDEAAARQVVDRKKPYSFHPRTTETTNRELIQQILNEPEDEDEEGEVSFVISFPDN